MKIPNMFIMLVNAEIVIISLIQIFVKNVSIPRKSHIVKI